MQKKGDNNWLSEYREKSVSQFGEEGVLKKIFEIIGEENNWCVEFGAVSGKNDSTSWDLINKQNWSGVLIEANPVYYKRLEENYTDNNSVTCINAYVNFEGENTLDNILQKTNIPKNFDFLSIDIDGNDYHVWDAIEEYSPRVVMVEYNGRIPVDIEFVQERNMNVQHGSSIASIAKLGKSKGYELIYAHMFNAIFVKKELFNLFNIKDNSPTALATSDFSDTRFFQLFDGSIVLSDSEKIQLLCHKKKIAGNPLWHLTNRGFYPLKFNRDGLLLRTIKKGIKRSFLYPILFPFARKRYKKIWKDKKKQLESE